MTQHIIVYKKISRNTSTYRELQIMAYKREESPEELLKQPRYINTYYSSVMLTITYIRDFHSMAEVFRPNDFTQLDRYGKIPPVYPHATEKLRGRGVAIPIISLSHVTHDKEADKIQREFTFKAQEKFGKTREYDGRSCGESWRPSKSDEGYFQIPDQETVFPGYYSWWGIHPEPHESYTTPCEIWKEQCALKAEKRFRTYVPDYIKVYAASRYGNHAFACEFNTLLAAYALARGTRIQDLYLRKGGTLRYTYEICYVLIICTDEDKKYLREFDPLTPNSKQFRMNGLINENGQICNLDVIPTFHPEYIISWSKHESQPTEVEADKYSYEHVAFAFYFSQKDSMRVDPEKCSESIVQHTYCIKTQPTFENGKRCWKCPNNIK